MSKRDLALDLFQSYKTGFTKKKKVIEERTQTPGDPTLIANVLTDLIAQLEEHGLVYYDDFFELSGNWPEWLRLFVMDAGA